MRRRPGGDREQTSLVSRDKVVPIRREPVGRRSLGGLLGLEWRMQAGGTGGRHHLVGVHPDRPGAVVARLKVEILPGYATPEDLKVGAAIWSDYEDGAAALMAADFKQQEGRDDG